MNIKDIDKEVCKLNKEIKTLKNSLNFIDPHKFKTIKQLNDKCRLHLWSINYNKKHVVNGFNKGDYYMKIARIGE